MYKEMVVPKGCNKFVRVWSHWKKEKEKEKEDRERERAIATQTNKDTCLPPPARHLRKCIVKPPPCICIHAPLLDSMHAALECLRLNTPKSNNHRCKAKSCRVGQFLSSQISPNPK